MATTYSVKQAIRKLEKGQSLGNNYKIKNGNAKQGGSYFAGSVDAARGTALVNDWNQAIAGAKNSSKLSSGQLSFRLVDSFSAISSNQGLLNPYTAVSGYVFTNPPGSLGAISSTQKLIVDGAANAALYTYTIAGTDPSYSLTSSSASVAEGQSVTFTLATTNVQAGTSLDWAITGIGQQFINGPLSGSVEVGPDGTATIPVSIETAINSGASFTFNIAGQTAAVTVTDPTPATFDLTSSSGTVAEGQSVFFTLTTTGVAAGTTFEWAITGIGQQFINGPLTGVAQIGPDGIAIIPVSIETSIDSGAPFSFEIAGQTAAVTITDPTPATYELTSSTEQVSNAQTVLFTLTTTGVAAGSTFQYNLTGLESSVIVGGATTGTAVVGSDGTAVVSVTLADLLPFNAAQTLTISFPGLVVGSQVLRDSVSVVNTAAPMFTIGTDTLFSNDGTNTVFDAPLQPNAFGQESNTLQGTDQAFGGDNATNSLVAAVIPQVTNGSGLVSSVVAIDPSTTNIQNVYLTATGGTGFFFGDFDLPVILDAYRNASWNMSDVEEWWSVQSDRDLIIQDATLNTSVGMDSTEAGVDYTVSFRGDLLTGDDAANVVLNNVGQGEEGGILTVGSTTPGNGVLGRRGIETFNVLIGETGSYLNALRTTGNRLTTVNVDEAPLGLGAPGAPIGTATAATVLEIDEAFEDLSTFDAEGFIGQIGSLQSRNGDGGLFDVRMEFNYNSVPALGSTINGEVNIMGGDGGNVMGVFIGVNTGIDLTFNGGESDDDMVIDEHEEGRGGSNSISVNTGNGENFLRILSQNTGALTAVGGDDDDDFHLEEIDATATDTGTGIIQVDLGDGDNRFLGADIDATTFSLAAGDGFDDLEGDDHGLSDIDANSIAVNVGNGGTFIDATSLTASNGSLSIEAGDGASNTLDAFDLAVTNGDLSVNFGDATANTITIVTASVTDGDAEITVGEGDASIDITDLSVDVGANGGGNLTITSEDGNDEVDLTDVGVDILATINLGNGNNDLTINGGSSFGNELLAALPLGPQALLITTGTGTDDVTIADTGLIGDATITTGAADDSVSITDSDFDQPTTAGDEVTTINTEAGSDTVFILDSDFDVLNINTGSEVDEVTLDGVTAAEAINVNTEEGDDQVNFFNTNPGLLDVDMGAGYDTFITDENLADLPANTPVRFTNIEKLVLQRDDNFQVVDMAALNAVSGLDIEAIREAQAAGVPVDLNGLVQDIWVQPRTFGVPGVTVVENVASDLGQNVTISNASLIQPDPFPWTTFNGFVGNVAISTLIGDEADNRTLRVTLEAADNGDVGNSTLAVGALDITDNSIGFASVEVVRLTSTSEDADAQPNARNVVQYFDAYNDDDASGIELLRIVGDTDLALHIGGEDGSVGLRSTDDTVDVRADSLDGDLQLVLDAGFEGEDAFLIDQYGLSDGNRADRIEANGAFENLLVLYGNNMLVNTVNLDTDPLLDNADTTYISGFDTIQFGTNPTGVMSDDTGLGLGLSLGASGLFDAIGMTPGITYDIVNTSGALTLDNLASTVTINTTTVASFEDITLNDRDGDIDEILDLSLYVQEGGANAAWTGGSQNVFINGFEEVNVSLAPNVTGWSFDLFLDGTVSALSFTSEADQPSGALNLSADDGQTFLMPTTIEVLDVSGYNGSFTWGFQDNQKTVGDPDVTFVIGNDPFNFTLTPFSGITPFTALAEFNSIFTLTDNESSTWSITNFIAGGLTGANENNVSQIDFRDIGITLAEFANVNVLDNGDDLVITWQDIPGLATQPYDFNIVLEGLGAVTAGTNNDTGLITQSNYIFAS